jgi:NADPH2:quinone reductase
VKGIRIHRVGGLDALCYEEIPLPSPGPGEATVRVEAAGVNYIDIYFRTGVFQAELPLTLGREGAGTVIAVDPDVRAVKVGDRVAWTGVSGAYAECAVVPADRLVVLPTALPTKDAAAAFMQGLTAHYLACSTYPLGPDDICLIHAAAGGVGLLLCQIAKMRGARVLATVSTDEKARIVRQAGADHAIIYTREDFEAEVRRLTSGAGVQVVYDGVGRATFEKGLNCLAACGTMVLYGHPSGTIPPFDPRALNRKGSLFLTWPTLLHYTPTRERLVGRASELFDWLLAGRVRLRVHAEYALHEAEKAHRALEARQTIGKVLLIP